MKDNEDFGLFAAAKITVQEEQDFLSYTSTSLRSSKTFMMKAVAHNPALRSVCIGDLSKDFDLAVMAFSQKIDCCAHLFGFHEDPEAEENYDYKSELEFLHSLATKAREKVRELNEDEEHVGRLRPVSLYLLFKPNPLDPHDENPKLMPKPERFFKCE